jgi:hypothetical protein
MNDDKFGIIEYRVAQLEKVVSDFTTVKER